MKTLIELISERAFQYFKDGGTIRINPENKGKFNATKKRTDKTTEELTHSKNPITRKRAIFAQNAAKWKYHKGGIALSTLSEEPIGYDNAEIDVSTWKKPWQEIPEGLWNSIRWNEGFVAQSYGDKTGKIYNVGDEIDPRDTLTIGFGRTEGVKPGDTTTREFEKKWTLNRLNDDKLVIARELGKNNITKLKAHQYYALSDLAYNGGAGLARKAIKNSYGDLTELGKLINQYGRTNKVTGKEEPGLVRRVEYRTDMWNGVWPMRERIYQYQLTDPELVADGILGEKTIKSLRKAGYSNEQISRFKQTGDWWTL